MVMVVLCWVNLSFENGWNEGENAVEIVEAQKHLPFKPNEMREFLLQVLVAGRDTVGFVEVVSPLNCVDGGILGYRFFTIYQSKRTQTEIG